MLEDLQVRSLLDDTLVVVVGEFGAHRRESYRGTMPAATTGLYATPACLPEEGIRGGMVWGKSDKEGKFVKQHPVSPEDLTATIYQALGITTADRLSLGQAHPGHQWPRGSRAVCLSRGRGFDSPLQPRFRAGGRRTQGPDSFTMYSGGCSLLP